MVSLGFGSGEDELEGGRSPDGRGNVREAVEPAPDRRRWSLPASAAADDDNADAGWASPVTGRGHEHSPSGWEACPADELSGIDEKWAAVAQTSELGHGLNRADLSIGGLKATEAASAESAGKGRQVNPAGAVDVDEEGSGSLVSEIEEEGRFDSTGNDAIRNAVQGCAGGSGH